MNHQHFDRKLINEMKTSSDTSKHIASYKRLVGKRKSSYLASCDNSIRGRHHVFGCLSTVVEGTVSNNEGKTNC